VYYLKKNSRPTPRSQRNFFFLNLHQRFLFFSGRGVLELRASPPYLSSSRVRAVLEFRRLQAGAGGAAASYFTWALRSAVRATAEDWSRRRRGGCPRRRCHGGWVDSSPVPLNPQRCQRRWAVRRLVLPGFQAARCLVVVEQHGGWPLRAALHVQSTSLSGR
jgi:hypothetical protein